MQKTKKHPTGLYYLFFTEMWERFGYYLMIAIFTLYLETDKAEGGWGIAMKSSSSIYGTFIALVFLTPFIGGLLADRKFGYIKSIVIGGLLMGSGYCLMAVHNLNVFYLSCGLVILGNGFFKPNISTLLGNLYNNEEYKASKDAGYNIFYMGINVGAFICTFVAAAMRFKFGWGGAFFSAGVGMFIGVIIFLLGIRHYKQADYIKPISENDTPLKAIFLNTLLPSCLAAAVGWNIGWILKFVLGDSHPENLFGDNSTDAFIFACIPVIIFYAKLYFKTDEGEKPRIRVMYLIFLVVILFWAVFKQNGTALNKWMKFYTDREMPASVLPLAENLHQLESIKVESKERPLLDQQFRPVLAANGEPSKEINIQPYFNNISPDKKPQEGQTVNLIPVELSQSINPGWVILLTPVVVGFFLFLRKRKLEPTTPSKIAWGLFISALSPLVMVGAVMSCGNGLEKAPIGWLIGTYGVITIGELFLSPMGLSMVSKLSPARLTALMMGGWFLSTSIGNKLSGVLASFWDKYDNKAWFFCVNSILLGCSAITLFILLKQLNRVFRELVEK